MERDGMVGYRNTLDDVATWAAITEREGCVLPAVGRTQGLMPIRQVLCHGITPQIWV